MTQLYWDPVQISLFNALPSDFSTMDPLPGLRPFRRVNQLVSQLNWLVVKP